MGTVSVLQLGTKDFSKVMQVSDCAEWFYEPDFSELLKKNFDVVILDREITADEFAYLMRFSMAYCLFVTEKVPLQTGTVTEEFVQRKAGKIISGETVGKLLREELPDYFPGSYGERFPNHISIAQWFGGSVIWKGFEGVDLEGDYGNDLTQILFWRYNIPISGKQAMEFWLEYTKDDTVEISLEISIIYFRFGTDPESQKTWSLSEKELEDIFFIENEDTRSGFVFVSLKAKGSGRLTVTSLHDRHSRRGKGYFIPGGKREVTLDREEIFYYFNPGNLKPPLNVYFSGFRTQEGFEGYGMMCGMEHPFLLFTDVRLEGGDFYIGSEEYENTVEQIIRKHMEILGFQNSDVILSGLSMGSFGALYYGCKIRPNTILVGKPLASLGEMCRNERLTPPGGSHSWLDVLHKAYGSLDEDAIRQMDDKFWALFDRTDWSGTRFAAAYMIEDELDGSAYEDLQYHLKSAGARIYGKGLHGRHNDNTPGIVEWFKNQYREIIQNDFDNVRRKVGIDNERDIVEDLLE